METKLMGLIDAGDLDNAKTYITETLWREKPEDAKEGEDQGNENGLLTGELQDYLTEEGVVDKAKTQDLCTLSKDACQLRIDEMNEAMQDGWEDNLA